MRRPVPLLLCLLVLFLIHPIAAHAGYLSISESAEIAPPNQYEFGFSPQLILNNGSGGNLDGFIDIPYNDSTSIRAVAGFGKVDFYGGGSMKYIPFPDVDNQPAIGGRAGAYYSRTNGDNAFTIQVMPLFSRKLETENGRFVPYVGVPINFTSATSRTWVGEQFVGGTEWHHPDWQMLFTGELAISLNDSYSALTFSVAFPFDGVRGFRRRGTGTDSDSSKKPYETYQP